MKKTILSLILFSILFITGCGAGSKVIKSTNEVKPLPEAQEQSMLSRGVVSVPQPPMDIKPLAAPVAAIAKSERMTYSQITDSINRLIEIKEIGTIPGENRYRGVSENNLITVELEGDKENIITASIKLFYPPEISKIDADLNNAMMARFLKNAVPGFTDWQSRVNDIFKRFNAVPLEGGMIDKENIVIKGRVIDVLYDKNMNSITLTLHRIEDYI